MTDDVLPAVRFRCAILNEDGTLHPYSYGMVITPEAQVCAVCGLPAAGWCEGCERHLCGIHLGMHWHDFIGAWVSAQGYEREEV